MSRYIKPAFATLSNHAQARALSKALERGNYTKYHRMLTSLTEEKQEHYVASHDFLSVRIFAARAKIEPVTELLDIAGRRSTEAIVAFNFEVVFAFAKRGKFEEVDIVMSRLDHKAQSKVYAFDGYLLLRLMLEHNRFELFKSHFDDLTRNIQVQFIMYEGYKALITLAKLDNIEGVESLSEYLPPKRVVEAIKYAKGKIIKLFAEIGDTEAVNTLLSHLSVKEAQQILKEDKYGVIRVFAERCDFESVDSLLEKLDHASLVKALKVGDNLIIRNALLVGDIARFNKYINMLDEDYLEGLINEPEFSILYMLLKHNKVDDYNHYLDHLYGMNYSKFAVSHNHYPLVRLAALNMSDQFYELFGNLNPNQKEAALHARKFGIIKSFIATVNWEMAKDMYALLSVESQRDFYRVLEIFECGMEFSEILEKLGIDSCFDSGRISSQSTIPEDSVELSGIIGVVEE